MKKINSFIYIIAAFLIVMACTEDNAYRKPIDDGTEKPENVSETSTSSFAGQVAVIFKLPDNPAISHVKANYVLSTGQEREVKVSAYTNYMLLDGFADTLLHDVDIYTVTRSGVASDPITIRVKALEAPIWKVRATVDFVNLFGGFGILADNPDNGTLQVLIMTKNAFGEYEVDNELSFGTSLATISKSFRGYDTTVLEFKYFVVDNWGNSTDTATVSVKPLFETEIPKSGYKEYKLPGDAPQWKGGETRLAHAWDGRYNWPWTSFTDQTNGGNRPHIVTFDMGVKAKVSRLYFIPYAEFWYDRSIIQYYYLTSMKRFELYGSTAPNPSGALDSTWVMMGSYEVEKPSGSPYGQDAPEDIAAAEAGWSFDVDISAPMARYIRIRCLENWSGGTAQNIQELWMYGDPNYKEKETE